MLVHVEEEAAAVHRQDKSAVRKGAGAPEELNCEVLAYEETQTLSLGSEQEGKL